MRKGYIMVTGSNRGIGAAIARALAADGAQVAGLSRSGQTAAGEGFVCDVTDEAVIATAVAAVAARGPIVGLVNNAGLYEEKRSDELTAADFDRLMRTNATSVAVVSREVYPHLRRAAAGSSSTSARSSTRWAWRATSPIAPRRRRSAPSPAVWPWSGRAMTSGVVNVAPGYIVTDLNRDSLSKSEVRRWLERRIPVGRPGTPEEVATLVATLFKSEIGFLTGETIYLDGGQSLHQ